MLLFVSRCESLFVSLRDCESLFVSLMRFGYLGYLLWDSVDYSFFLD